MKKVVLIEAIFANNGLERVLKKKDFRDKLLKNKRVEHKGKAIFLDEENGCFWEVNEYGVECYVRDSSDLMLPFDWMTRETSHPGERGLIT